MSTARRPASCRFVVAAPRASRSRRAASRRTGSGSPSRHRSTDDAEVAPTAALEPAARGLADAIAALEGQGVEPFLPPHRFDDAGWVANRWCEILPIPMPAKQKLMALPDPLLRLEVVDDILRRKANA